MFSLGHGYSDWKIVFGKNKISFSQTGKFLTPLFSRAFLFRIQYCAAGGIPPHRVLPVVLDVGTDNEKLLNDKFYIGVQKKRLRGKEYYHLVDEFMNAVRYRWPNVLVQFEDFDSSVAQRLLDKYRETHLCFNDDIQGTGATALAGLLGALRAKGEDVNSLGDQRIAIAGAGSAGIGIAQVLYEAMLEQGYSEEKAKDAFYIVDHKG